MPDDSRRGRRSPGRRKMQDLRMFIRSRFLSTPVSGVHNLLAPGSIRVTLKTLPMVTPLS
jgi:hypothetical protein